MRIKIKTQIPLNYLEVFESFDLELLKYLTDEGQVKIVHVDGDGAHIGDRVELLILKPFKGEWVSRIVDRNVTKDMAFFRDIGESLPFGLKSWEHIHIVEKTDESNCVIIDEIRFTTRIFFVALFFYLPFWFSFNGRKKKYKSYLLKKKN